MQHDSKGVIGFWIGNKFVECVQNDEEGEDEKP